MKRALALFDFDGTLIPGDSIVQYTRFARLRGKMGWGEYMKSGLHGLGYLLGLENEEQSKNHALAFRRRMTGADRDALDRAFADTLLRRVYPAARACMDQHRQAGGVLLLVTASPSCYMDLVGAGLGFDAVIATPMADGVTVRRNCKGEEKVRRVREWLENAGIEADFAQSRAYGDSKSDLPMLRLCGHPTLVNPKQALAKSAPDIPRVKW